jgi:ABC-type lipoprotein release transport system permease subunit
MINAVDVKKQKAVSDLYQAVVRGTYFGDEKTNSIVIGQQLADKLHVNVHSRIVMTLQTIEGEITYAAFTVVGIFRTHNSDFDKQQVFVQKKDLQQLINFPPHAASLITILLKKTEDTKKLKEKLESEFPSLQVQGWEKLSPMIQVMSSTVDQMALIFVGIILIALAFGIINTMLMAVLDRTREIGMLLCIGMKPSKVFRMVMLETVFMSLTGAACGLLLSIGTIKYFHHSGIDLSKLGEGANALGYSTMVYPALGLGFYVELVILVIVIAMIAGLFPALRAIRMNPAEAVRGE